MTSLLCWLGYLRLLQQHMWHFYHFVKYFSCMCVYVWERESMCVWLHAFGLVWFGSRLYGMVVCVSESVYETFKFNTGLSSILFSGVYESTITKIEQANCGKTAYACSIPHAATHHLSLSPWVVDEFNTFLSIGLTAVNTVHTNTNSHSHYHTHTMVYVYEYKPQPFASIIIIWFCTRLILAFFRQSYRLLSSPFFCLKSYSISLTYTVCTTLHYTFLYPTLCAFLPLIFSFRCIFHFSTSYT